MAETTTPKLSKEVFGVDVTNHQLLKLAYDSAILQHSVKQAQSPSEARRSQWWW
jgi:hypothetical protein